MQTLSGINAFFAVILALVIGVGIGLAFAQQIKLQRIAQRNPSGKEGRIGERITYAGLSFALLATAILVGKHVLSIGYETFMLVTATSAIGSLIVRLKSGANRK